MSKSFSYDPQAGRRWVIRWFGGLFAVAFIIVIVPQVVDGIQVLRGEGVQGTFTATGQECDRRSCQWVGTFVAYDNTVRHRAINLSGGGVDGIGDQVAAMDTGHRYVVYRRGSISSLLWPLVILLASLLGLWIWIRVVGVPLWRRLRK